MPRAGAGVEVEEDDLLPRPQGETAVDDRDSQGGPHEGASDVRMTIVIAPAQMMAVVPIRRG